jgi:hypothetical protein
MIRRRHGRKRNESEEASQKAMAHSVKHPRFVAQRWCAAQSQTPNLSKPRVNRFNPFHDPVYSFGSLPGAERFLR